MALNGLLHEELERWAEEYGKERTAKSGAMYYAFDFQGRHREQCLVILISRLKELGAEKGSFKAGPTRRSIIEFCLPPKHTYLIPAKYGRACTCVAKELDRAVLKVYGSESDYYKKNGETRNIEVEQTDLEKQAVELEALEQKVYEDALKREATNTPVPEETVVFPPPPPRKKWKELKKELIASGQLVEEQSNSEVDPEMAKLFGIKTDE